MLLFETYTLLPLRAKYYFNKQKQLQVDATISFDNDFICEKSSIQELKLKNVERYLLCKEMLLIYNTPKTFIMVPKRFCKDEQQFYRIVEITKKLFNNK